jgi:hypothetical protein
VIVAYIHPFQKSAERKEERKGRERKQSVQ